MNRGSRDDAAVRVLASHQCGPGSIPGLGVICGLSLLLVLVLAPRSFFPGTPVFPSSKTNTFKFQFDLDYCQALYHEPLAREIEQVLPVLLALNRLLFFQARFITTLLSPHVILRLCPRSGKTTEKISCKFFRVSHDV